VASEGLAGQQTPFVRSVTATSFSSRRLLYLSCCCGVHRRSWPSAFPSGIVEPLRRYEEAPEPGAKRAFRDIESTW
jgi:hypothetical protein